MLGEEKKKETPPKTHVFFFPYPIGLCPLATSEKIKKLSRHQTYICSPLQGNADFCILHGHTVSYHILANSYTPPPPRRFISDIFRAQRVRHSVRLSTFFQLLCLAVALINAFRAVPLYDVHRSLQTGVMFRPKHLLQGDNRTRAATVLEVSRLATTPPGRPVL